MKAPRFVGNKVKLGTALGISRTLLYQFMRLPDAPAPRPDGRHDARAWRKFLASHSGKVKDASEGDKLKIALLKVRLEREQLELAELDNSIRSDIAHELGSAFSRIIEVLKYQLQGLPNQIAGKLEGRTPMEIYHILDTELRSRFERAHNELQKIVAQSKRKTPKKKEESDVIPFKRNAAN